MMVNPGDSIKASDINTRIKGISGYLGKGESVTIKMPTSGGFLFYGGGQNTNQFAVMYISPPFSQKLLGSDVFVPGISYSENDTVITLTNTQSWGQAFTFISSTAESIS